MGADSQGLEFLEDHHLIEPYGQLSLEKVAEDSRLSNPRLCRIYRPPHGWCSALPHELLTKLRAIASADEALIEAARQKFAQIRLRVMN